MSRSHARQSDVQAEEARCERFHIIQLPDFSTIGEIPNRTKATGRSKTIVDVWQRRCTVRAVMASDRTILITGVTGNQGGAVAQALQGTGFYLRGLTRKPGSERAAALARDGIDIVKGDLDDEATLRRALTGAWGVFGVQNAGEAGVEREEAQGKRLATLAREAGVEHYVYTSVGSAHKRTGVPHFDNKWRIEETVRGLHFPSHVILRPVF